VPKTVNLEEEFRNASDGSAPTTLMVRNLPNRYLQSDLLEELEEVGFGGTFDFLYVPMDTGRYRHHGARTTASNVGYAFVNFVEASLAEKFMAVFRGRSFSRRRERRSQPKL
jgi:hypothetical protein